MLLTACFVVSCLCLLFFFFFKQKTAYEMRISDWSSDVCSSDLTELTMHMPPTGLYEAPLPTDWPEPEALGFGRVLGPYIAHAQHGEDGGWHAPCVSARNALPVPVASGGLQYGFSVDRKSTRLNSSH